MPNFNLDGLLAFWNSLTPKDRKELAANINKFHGLRNSLQKRGIVECDKNLTKIKILKAHPGIKRLKTLLKKIGAQGIEIIDERKKNKAKLPLDKVSQAMR